MRDRNKPDSSDPVEKKKVNWAKEYLKLQETNFKLQEAKDKLQEVNVKINEKLNEDLRIEKDLRIAEAHKFNAEALNMGVLKSDLAHAMTELLRIKGKLSPRGAIEFFEERGSSLSRSVSKLSRGDKWKIYYQKDYNRFKTEMQLKFPILISMTLDQQEDFVTDLVSQTYSNTSCFHQSFDLQEGVYICPSDYPQSQMSFLEIVCKCLPCKYTTVGIRA